MKHSFLKLSLTSNYLLVFIFLMDEGNLFLENSSLSSPVKIVSAILSFEPHKIYSFQYLLGLF